MNAYNKRGFVSLIGLLFAVVIVCILGYSAFKHYFEKTSITNTQTEKVLKKEGIDTSSHVTILDSTKKKLKGIEAQRQQRAEDLLKDLSY